MTMAEVYGVKPKKFTKEWWPYFWLYYKWHTIVIVLAVIAIIYTIVEMSTQTKYDLKMIYYGYACCDDTAWQDLKAELEPGINDIDDNSEKNIDMFPLTLSTDDSMPQIDSATYVKYTTSYSEDLSQLYIFDKTQMDIIQNDKSLADAYETVDKWVKTDLSDDRVIKSDGRPIAVSLKGSAVLEKSNIPSEDLYVALKSREAQGQNEAAFENAIITANNLIK